MTRQEQSASEVEVDLDDGDGDGAAVLYAYIDVWDRLSGGAWEGHVQDK